MFPHDLNVSAIRAGTPRLCVFITSEPPFCVRQAARKSTIAPISSLPNLTYLRLWNQNGGNLATAAGDLAFLAPCKKLQTLELPGSRYTNTAVLAGLPELKSVDLSDAQEPVSIAFAAKLPNLTRLNLSRTTVTDGAVASTLPKTVRLTTDKKTQGLPAANP